MAYSDWLVDKRVIERNVRKGLVDPKELEKLHKQLPDRAENVAEAEGDEAEGEAKEV